MEKASTFKDLQVWQKAMELVEKIYLLEKHVPASERYALLDQLHRSAVSIPSNIAEGYRRKTRKDYLHFLHIAYGSLAELETQVILVNRLYPGTDTGKEQLLCEELGKMLGTLIRRLSE